MDGNLHDMIVRRVKPIIVLIAIPIVFSMIFSWCFGTVYVDEIPTAVLDMDQSSGSRDVIDRMGAGPGLKITVDAKTQDEVKEEMLAGNIQAALIIPEGFGSAISAGKGAEAMFLINGSNFMISNNAMLYASNTFNDLNRELRIGLLEKGKILPYESAQLAGSITAVDRVLYNPQISYLRYIILGLLAITIQQTYLTMLSALLVFTKDRIAVQPEGTTPLKETIKNLLKTAVIYGGCSVIGLYGALIALNRFFDIPLEGSMFLTLLLHGVFILDLTAVSLVIGAFFKDEAHCVQFDMFLAIPTMLVCSYAWPEYMMPHFFAPAMKALWPLYYFSIPLRDMHLKGLDFSMISQYLTGGLLFAAFWLPIAGWLYWRSISKKRSIFLYIADQKGSLK